MPDMASDGSLRAFLDGIDLWMEHVLGHRDFQHDTGQSPEAPRYIPALDILYDGYCAFRRGTINGATWDEAARATRALMSTIHFRRHWEARQAEFPEDFRAFIKDACQ